MIKYFKEKYELFLLNKLLKNFHLMSTLGPNFYAEICSYMMSESFDRSKIIFGANCRFLGNLHCSKSGHIEVGDYSSIMQNATLLSANSIKIGSYCGIAPNTMISDNNNHPTSVEGRIIHRIRTSPSGVGYPGGSYGWEDSDSAPITIGDGVWIGGNSTILKGITIGDGAIVARASVVTKDVAPFTVVAGNPAKKVKDLEIPSMTVADLGKQILSSGKF